MTRRGKLTLVVLAGLIGSATWAALPERDPPLGPPAVFPVVVASLPIPVPSPKVAETGPSPPAAPRAEPEPPPPRAKPAPSELPPVRKRRAGWRQEWLSPPVSRGAVESLAVEDGRYLRELADGTQTIRVHYTLDPGLTDSVWKVLRKGRVALGHVLVMDVNSGALHVYASTDPERFPPQGVYPAASLVKVVTAAAALGESPAVAKEICRYAGNPYRLRRSHLKEPRGGKEVSLRRALATSNNHCFARLAVDHVGSQRMLAAIDRFGLLRAPAVGHARGMAQVPDDPLALGKLGSGLAGLRITPLHAVQLAAVLAHGRRVEPYWVENGSSGDRVLPAPARRGAEPVMPAAMAEQLREMLVDTTRRGTARRAFRTRSGRPLLQGVTVAGKTGSLNGTDPKGRYEWFIGVAPADEPRIAIATLAVQGELYWMSASQLAAEVLKAALCPQGVCRKSALDRLATNATAGTVLNATPAVALASCNKGCGVLR